MPPTSRPLHNTVLNRNRALWGGLAVLFFITLNFPLSQGQGKVQRPDYQAWEDSTFSGTWDEERLKAVWGKEEAEKQAQALSSELIQLELALVQAQAGVEELVSELAGLQLALEEGEIHLAGMGKDLEKRRDGFAAWLRLLYKGGTGSLIAYLFGAESFSDFFTRYRLVTIILGRAASDLEGIEILIRETAGQNQGIADTAGLLAVRRQEAQEVTRRIANLKLQKDQALEQVRSIESLYRNELIGHERQWALVLPEIDYLLKHLSTWQWDGFTPDRVEVDYRSQVVLLTIDEDTLTRTFRGKDPRLAAVTLEVTGTSFIVVRGGQGGGPVVAPIPNSGTPGGILYEWGKPVVGPELNQLPDYYLAGQLTVDHGRRLLFVPEVLVIAGRPIDQQVVAGLSDTYNLSVSLPEMPQGLQPFEVKTRPGEVILAFKP